MATFTASAGYFAISFYLGTFCSSLGMSSSSEFTISPANGFTALTPDHQTRTQLRLESFLLSTLLPYWERSQCKQTQ